MQPTRRHPRRAASIAAMAARLMALTEPELRERYGWEWENGPAVILDEMTRVLRREARKGKITALMELVRIERRVARKARGGPAT